MIKLFYPMAVSYETNGLIQIKPLKADVYCDDDGEYYCNIEVPLNCTAQNGIKLNYTSYFLQGYIAIVPTLWGNQPFRLNNIERTPTSLKTKASHLVMDLKKYVLPLYEHMSMVDLEDAVAEIMLQGSVGTEFTTTITATNKSQLKTFDISDYPNNINVYEAFINAAKTWKAQIVINGTNITFRDYPSAISSDIVIKNAKNLESIKIVENWDSVAQRCTGVGHNNLRGTYIYPSPPYNVRYDRMVKFDPSDGVDQSVAAEVIADLESQAQAYVESHISPEINYTVTAPMDVIVNIGDPVVVKHTVLNVDLITTIISVTWDSIAGKYKKVEFGNFKPNVKGLVPQLNNKISALELRVGNGGL